MKHQPVFAAIVLLAASFAAVAADVAGKWQAQVPGRNGTRETTFVLQTDGGKLTGTMSVEGQQPSPIADGKISGDTVSFTATAERGGNTVKYTFTGTVAGDEIRFKREGGPGQPREFTAKRAK
jgi:hypothetical protein